MKEEELNIFVHKYNRNAIPFKINILKYVENKVELDYTLLEEIIIDHFDLYDEIKSIRMWYLSDELRDYSKIT